MTIGTRNNDEIILTRIEAEEFGKQLVKFFGLRRDTEHTDRVMTAWGTKTMEGVGYSVLRIINETVD